MDEAGRGPLAGPLVAAAVSLPPDACLQGVTDSKKLSNKKRRTLFPEIIKIALGYSTGIVEPSEIDKAGMAESVRLAFYRAAQIIDIQNALFLVDGLPIRNLHLKSRYIVKGDSKSLSIAAASIIAKVTRDDIMIKAESEFPGYDFASNKGYGSREHMKAIEKLGPSPIHRMSFAPLKYENQIRIHFE